MPRTSKGAFKVFANAAICNLEVWKHTSTNRFTVQGMESGETSRIRRRRRSVLSIYRELGDYMFRRSFRMSLINFKSLYSTLKPALVHAINEDNETKMKEKIHPVNGCIPMTVRLACAIRFWAGGDPYDISVMFGISYCEVFTSVNYSCDAVNNTPDLDIVFPTNHDKQQSIANAFLAISEANFGSCFGCLDGLLIWMHMPSKKECEEVKVGQKKFICGMKHKAGLNLQAICDSKRRFLDISILFAASSSDLLAFEASSIRSKLAEEGFLAPGLCLFGDNAYVNTKYMATPYPNVSNDIERDAYNFYHSQLRINIECAFGMLVQRWGFLKKKTPRMYTIKKVIATVSCLCKLHNFLIDKGASEVAEPPSTEDACTLAVDGSIQLATSNEEGQQGDDSPLVPALTGGGEHFDDDPGYHFRRNLVREYQDHLLPRDAMFVVVTNNNLRRPPRNVSRNVL